MGYRKFSAGRLFDGFTFIDQPKVLITDEDGSIEGLVDPAEAGDGIEEFEGTLCPGFINSHCHLELSHMKGMVPESTGLVDFVISVVEQRHFPEEQILLAIEKAETEMLENGIVAVGDICNNLHSLPQKTRGRIMYHNFIEASGYPPEVAKARFERSLSFFREFARYYQVPVDSNSIVPHAPYSVSPELWEMLVNFPGNNLFTIHNQETESEDEWFIGKKGKLDRLYEKLKIDTSFFTAPGTSSLQNYLRYFLPNQQVILVHNVFTKQEDISLTFSTRQNKFFWCLCVNANQYISGALPPIELLIKNNCDIVLGTDSLASNHSLNLMDEIRTIKKNFPAITLEEMLKWACSNGAKAIRAEGVLGSFEAGKKPGVLVIDEQNLSCLRIL